MQIGTLSCGPSSIQFDFPAPDEELLPGISWGAIEAFPSPAYWAYQVLARRILGEQLHYRLGKSLREEVAACLLGGHGIPASVGIAAFHVLRDEGFLDDSPAEEVLYERLCQPLSVDGRQVHYRFARQKSRFVSEALRKLDADVPPTQSGKALRTWLLQIKGVGPKTASWIARNWLNADDVAILDIHIDRACRLFGLFPEAYTIERHYFELEDLFIAFASSLGVRASELDAVIWLEMMSSPSTVRALMSKSDPSEVRMSGARSNKRRSYSFQAAMFD